MSYPTGLPYDFYFDRFTMDNGPKEAPTGITFRQIHRGDTGFAKVDLQKILSGRINRATVTFADKDQVHGLPMSRDLMIRVWVHSESTLALFDSEAIPNVIS